MNNKYIICADDFGLTKSVNKAVIDVFNKNNLTHASLMVNMPGKNDAFRLAKIYKNLNVGLHFNITEGKSLFGKSSLTNSEGLFYSRKELVIRYFRGLIKSKDIQNELYTQMHEFQKAEIKLETLDSHQHIHAIPLVFNSIINILIEKRINIRFLYSDTSNFLSNINFKSFNKLIINFLTYNKRKKYKVFRNDIFTSVHHYSKIFTEIDYINIIKKACEKNIKLEVMIHPYIEDNDLKSLYKDDYLNHIGFLKYCFKEYEILSQKPLFNDIYTD